MRRLLDDDPLPLFAAAEAREPDLAKQAWYRADRERREQLILRDIGVMGHYVGDGSQPHHTSIHYNGWGDYPNPEGFTNSRRTHGLFEGDDLRLAQVDAERDAPAAALGVLETIEKAL